MLGLVFVIILCYGVNIDFLKINILYRQKEGINMNKILQNSIVIPAVLALVIAVPLCLGLGKYFAGLSALTLMVLVALYRYARCVDEVRDAPSINADASCTALLLVVVCQNVCHLGTWSILCPLMVIGVAVIAGISIFIFLERYLRSERLLGKSFLILSLVNFVGFYLGYGNETLQGAYGASVLAGIAIGLVVSVGYEANSTASDFPTPEENKYIKWSLISVLGMVLFFIL